MTQEDKKLLFIDLCARLPYDVILAIGNKNPYQAKLINEYLTIDFIEVIKPYLRPMSSMTEEEKEDYHKLCDSYYGVYFDSVRSIDWLNAHYFDYRKDDKGKTMIDKGLALEALEGMYNLNNK